MQNWVKESRGDEHNANPLKQEAALLQGHHHYAGPKASELRHIKEKPSVELLRQVKKPQQSLWIRKKPWAKTSY